MRILLTTLLLSILTVLPVWAQSPTSARASQIARQLSSIQELPVNLRLRFEALADNTSMFEGKNDPRTFLSFFSDTRVLFWNRSFSQGTQGLMTEFEGQVTGLARQRGLNADQSSVGYASDSIRRLLSREVTTIEGFRAVTLSAEEQATNLLASQPSQQLLELRDSLTRLRLDMQDGTASTESVRSVLGARAKFMIGDVTLYRQTDLEKRLNKVAEVFQVKFPAEVLRGQRGQQIRL